MVTTLPNLDKSAIYTALVEFSDTAVICKSTDGIILAWNLGAEKLFGYMAGDVVGKPISIIVPDHLLEEERRILERIKRDERIEFWNTQRRRRDGSLVDVSLSVSPVHDAKGNVVGAAKIARDISAQRQAERRFEQVVESAPYGIIVADRDGTINLVNRQAELLFGYERSELIGEPVELLISDTGTDLQMDLRSALTADPMTAVAGAPRTLKARHSTGRLFSVELRLAPTENEKGTMTNISLIDITRRLEAEEHLKQFHQMLEQQVADRTAKLKAANRELKEFAYVASHDLKAPLRVIDNTSRWLMEDLQGLLTEDMLDNMRLMRSRVVRMEKFLDDLLDYSRIGRMAQATIQDRISGRALIDDVILMLSPPGGFDIQVSPVFAELDLPRMPLTQIFLNLVGNAIKHHDLGRGVIRIDAACEADHYVFTVADDGPGIPEIYRTQVFEMFQTLRPRDEVEGSGMGLSIARKHVVHAGGTIEIAPAEGRGATFRFTWPVKQKPQDEDDGD
ncbi:sensor histidine kinase [Rhizobium halophytocola]|uniref:histidine kinase n=1 Tax=Rhizobium halophytocola TaxID=735519 RepID=A0ABS4E6H5_9HYPH|nr:PAS domain S-box protein [Rhizobium halophytocola]MBP1853545.1 PAS domain S-box-containing protein [Rhizobium halophytocola]